MKMNKMDQKILVVETKKLFPDEIWEGFREVENPSKFLKLIDKFGQYKRRGDMEENPDFKQIIPQIALISTNKIFVHQIPGTGSEGRLHGLWPIFLGGHIEESDSNIVSASEREFFEEIDYQGKILKKDFVGLINYLGDEVGKVHFGLVWVFEGDSEKHSATGDSGIANGKFVSWEEASELVPNMTHWSALAFPAIRKKYDKK